MKRKRFYYLVKVQFLGYRLHGWQHQPNLKTVEGLIKKTLRFILPEKEFKILGASRTDAMVSAQDAAFELFLYDEPIEEFKDFIDLFNLNLPPDISVTSIREVDSQFNIIQHPKKKEYIYLFAFGKKSHPFCAPFLATFQKEIDIDLMKKGAKIFQGKHDFTNYCTKPSEFTKVEREIFRSEILENTLISASFLPEKTFMFSVEGEGFLRNQIRLMMGNLVLLGQKEINLEQLQESLEPGNKAIVDYIAPASGLILNKTDFY